MKYSLPPESTLLEGRDDAGKRVVINSVGGALVGVWGTVQHGPYIYPYTFRYKKVKKVKGKVMSRIVEEERVSAPWWMVHIDGYDRCVPFVEKELTMPCCQTPPS